MQSGKMKNMKKIFKVLSCLLLFGLLGGCSQQQSVAVSASSGSYHSQLVKQKKRLQKTSSSLKEKLAVKRYQSSSMKTQWKSQRSLLQASQTASSNTATASTSAAISSAQTASSSATTTRSTNQITTGQSRKIIGNKNSHIYHVPGQAGYKINAANAVYFSTEAQAQAAGYRKALR